MLGSVRILSMDKNGAPRQLPPNEFKCLLKFNENYYDIKLEYPTQPTNTRIVQTIITFLSPEIYQQLIEDYHTMYVLYDGTKKIGLIEIYKYFMENQSHEAWLRQQWKINT